MTNLVKLTKFEELTGYTPKAVQRKVAEGVWLEGFEVIKAPDGNWLVIMEGYERWAAGQQRVAYVPPVSGSRSASPGEVASTAPRSRSVRLLPT